MLCLKLCPLLFSLLNKINNLRSLYSPRFSKFFLIAFDWNLFPIFFLLLSSSSSMQQNYTHIFYQIKDSIRKYSEPVLFIYFSPDSQTLWWCCPGSQSGRTYTTRTNNLFSLLRILGIYLFIIIPRFSFPFFRCCWCDMAQYHQQAKQRMQGISLLLIISA